MVGYNPQRHKTLFGAAVFGHNVTDGEPIQGHTDFLGVLRIIANVMFFIVLFIGGVKFFEWNDKRKERNELRRSAEKKGMMNDTDPAPTGSDDIELMVWRSSSPNCVWIAMPTPSCSMAMTIGRRSFASLP